MRKLSNNRKGMTLIEVMVSLAVLGIISVPLMMTFTNTIMVTKLTQDQIEVNAVSRIVKETVINAVKNAPSPIETLDTAANPVSYDAVSGGVVLRKNDTIEAVSFQNGIKLRIKDSSGNYYDKYAFDAEYDGGPYPLTGCDLDFPNTCKYVVTIYKNDSSNRVVTKLKLDINLIKD